MKKVVKATLSNCTYTRGIRDLNVQLYSHDRNNAGFEFTIKNEVDLSQYRATVLFDFQDTFTALETKGTIEGNVVKVKFDTDLITKCEEVIGYLMLDSDTNSLDVFKFKFNVVLSQIDRPDLGKRGFRYIKDQEVVDVITRSELEEEIKKLQVNGGIDLSNYLTTSVAEETYATKQELSTYALKSELPSTSDLVTTEQLTIAKNSIVEEISNKGYVTTSSVEETYAKKTDLPTPYNDSGLVERVTNLENKTDRDTVYDDTNVKERLTTLENKPPVDLSNYATKEELAHISGSQPSVDNLVTKDELASKNYLTTHQDISNLATKEELQEVRNSQPTVDTSNLVTRQELEDKHYATEQSLNNYALKSELPQPYNDSALVQKIGQLEARVDKDTVYDDTPLKERVTALESKALEGGAYDDTHLRERLNTLEAKQDKDTVYDDAPLKERVTALETKVDKDTVYNDEEVKRRLTELESRPTVDTTHFVTTETLSKNFLTTTVAEETYAKKSEIPQAYNDSALSERVTNLENKTDKDTVYDDTNIKERLTNLENKPTVDTSNFVTNEALEEKHYVTSEQISSTYATKSEIPQPYSDTELVKRITVLENKQDNDTVYDDAELKRRVTALEEKPNVDTSNFVTTEVLESKGYLTTHQDTSNFALKTEIPQPYNDSALVSRVQALESKQDNDTVYDDTKVKERLMALESKPTVDTSKFITDEKLIAKNFVTKDELNTLKPNQTLSLTNGVLSISGGNNVELPASRWEIHGTGMPNGVVEAEIGTTYIDKNKTNGAFKWIKTTNGGNRGWEVLSGDTGWRTLNSVSKLGNSFVKVRRVNNEVTYQFGGLSWGWFGIVRRGGNRYVAQTTDIEKNCKILNDGGVPEGFRTPNSLIGPIYNDRGTPYGTWYVGNASDLNHLRFQFLNPVPTDSDIGDIRVSTISYFTDDPWPQQLP